MGSKNSSSGVEWAVHPDALFSELGNEDYVKNELKELLDFEENDPVQLDLLNEAKLAVEAWYQVYHAVILLAATVYPLQENVEINGPEPHDQKCSPNSDERCLEICHLAPAYTLDEEYLNSQFPKYNVILEKIIEEDFVKRRLGIDGNGSIFVDEHIKAQPRFKFFFDQLNPFLQKFTAADFASANSGWDQNDYLDSFHTAVLEKRVSNETRAQYTTYVGRLRNLLAELWGADIKANLGEMHSWLDPTVEVGSEDWWIENLGLTPLRDAISSLFDSDNEVSIKKSHKIAAVSYLNEMIFTFIQIRFEEPDDEETSHGLIGVLDRYAELDLLVEDSDEQLWADILSITSGALAWQIYRQASSTVTAMKTLIGG